MPDMQDAAASPLLPTYARADVAFVRGEGAWLEASDGSRYLDFGAGIAVCALGHVASPPRGGAERSRRRSSGTSRTCSASPRPSALAPPARATRRSPITCSSPIPARKRSRARSRRRASIMRPAAIPSASVSSRSRARSTAARWRRSPPAAIRNTSKASARKVEGFDQVPFGDHRGCEGGHRPARRRACSSSRSRARAACACPRPASCARCASCATSAACCLCSTRCRAAWAAPASCSRTNCYGVDARHHGGRQGHRRRLPARRVPGDEGGGQGHDRRHAWHDLWRQSAGDERRRRGARRHPGARLPRRGRAQGPALQAEAGGPEGPVIQASSPKCAARA